MSIPRQGAPWTDLTRSIGGSPLSDAGAADEPNLVVERSVGLSHGLWVACLFCFVASVVVEACGNDRTLRLPALTAYTNH